MPTVTLSSKHQITLPMEVVRAFGLKPGDKLVVLPMEWRIVVMKESETTVEHFMGSLEGVYGSTVEEIDQYIDDLRGGRRERWIEEVRDLIEGDDDVREVVERLREFPRCKATFSQLETAVSAPGSIKYPPKGSQAYDKSNQKLWVVLEMLKEAGAVREVRRDRQEPFYYLVREFVRD